MRAGSTLALIVFLCLVGSVVPAAAQSIRYVDDDASTNGDGLTWDTAYMYLQDALFEASGGWSITEIHVAGGTYKPDQDEGGQVTPGDREARFLLRNILAIMGGYRGCPGGDCSGDPDERDIGLYETVLSGDLAGDDGPEFANNDENSYHVVNGSSCIWTAVLDGFTISSGNADGDSFHGHNQGGGMCNYYGKAIVANCTFTGNWAEDGGGMLNRSNAQPTVTNCRFSGNRAQDDGGAMCNWWDSYPIVTNCTFTGNWAQGNGGGIYNWSGCSPRLTNCTFSGNLADDGGAMFNWGSCSPRLTNCSFSGNSAQDDGGGMFNWSDSSPTLTNCVFSGNSADYGGGLYNWGETCNPTLSDSIMWNDLPGEIAGPAVATYSDIQGGWPGEGNIDADPLFVDPDGPDDVAGTEDDNLRLSPGSPCIDAGNDLAVPVDWADLDGDGEINERTPLDLWGIPRFIDDLDTEDTGVADPPDYPDVVDMGAYEYHVPGDLDFDGDIDGDDYWIFAAALPSCVGDSRYNPAADLDFDGCVTLVDYQIWLVLYRGANPPPPAPAPAPAKPGGLIGTGAHGEAAGAGGG